ncbi:MAG TPA: Fur family transcriptional regulator [Bacillota bacterium]|nr:Fur family transcriptional regulator [Bacillota bacterium]HOR85855.1 Fur family transcriptional regulator [Bacillota bacterium]HPL53705.1 Fur family transcriptional regulator [Bacillota bacterium]
MNYLDKTEIILKEKGYRLTGQRRLIIEAFNENPGHHTAWEIFNLVKGKSEGINFSTIYRNLQLLCTLRIIDKLQIESGVSHYELCGQAHHHHIICKGCGETKEIDICPYANMGEDKLSTMGFKVTGHKFEIYGYCSKCNLLKE